MFICKTAQVKHLNPLKKYGRSSSKTNVVAEAAPASLMPRAFVGAAKAGTAPGCVLPKLNSIRQPETPLQRPPVPQLMTDLLLRLPTIFLRIGQRHPFSSKWAIGSWTCAASDHHGFEIKKTSLKTGLTGSSKKSLSRRTAAGTTVSDGKSVQHRWRLFVGLQVIDSKNRVQNSPHHLALDSNVADECSFYF